MRVKLHTSFPYSRQTTSMYCHFNKGMIVGVEDIAIKPMKLDVILNEPNYDGLEEDYYCMQCPTATVDIDFFNQLRESAGLKKAVIEKWGVGTSHWVA